MTKIDVAEALRLQLDAANALSRERRLVALGLAAWSIRRYAKGEVAAAEVNERLGRLLPQLGDVPSMWPLVLDAIDHDVSEEMGWSNWILFEKKNMGRAMFLDTDSHLWRAFLIAALRRVGAAGEVRFAPSEAGRDAASIEDGDFWRAFREIQNDPKQIWQPLLENVERGPALDTIANAVRTALREQEVIDVDQLIASPVAQDTVGRVAGEIVEGWKKNGLLRTLIAAAGAHTFEAGPAPAGSHFGIFRLERKDIYVPDSRLHSDGWGDQFGRGLAHGENAAIVKAILSVASAFPAKSDTKWKEAVRRAIADLQKTYSGEYLAVLLVNASMAAWHLTSEPDFERAPRREFALGVLDGADVFEIHIDDAETVALVADLKHVGEWHQYAPNRKLPTEQQIAPGLLFGIAEITAEEAEKMIDEDAGLLERLGASNKESGIRELRRSVLFRLMEAFQFQIANSPAAFRIAIPEE